MDILTLFTQSPEGKLGLFQDARNFQIIRLNFETDKKFLKYVQAIFLNNLFCTEFVHYDKNTKTNGHIRVDVR